MENLIVLGIVIAFVAGAVLGVWWLFWSLWCWVMPQVWASGPEGIITPGYWLFVGVLLLLGFVGRTIFGRSKK